MVDDPRIKPGREGAAPSQLCCDDPLATTEPHRALCALWRLALGSAYCPLKRARREMSLSTKRTILFRFHEFFDVCDARLSRLQVLNPGVKIHGLYGGTRQNLTYASRSFLQKFESLHVLTQDSMWCWMFGGFLGVDSWYKSIGRQLDFDVLHLIEWDLLMEDSLANLYRHIEPECIGVTAPTPIGALKSEWLWLTGEEQKAELHLLLESIRADHGLTPIAHACFLTGACYPKLFLESISRWHVPSYCNDEILLCLYAQVAEIAVRDTGFLRNWRKFSRWSLYFPNAVVSDPFAGPRTNRIHRWFVDFRYFNCDGHDVSIGDIRKQLAHTQGRRVFHPVRY